MKWLNLERIETSQFIIIENPGQTHEVRPGRLVFQDRLAAGGSAMAFLFRVFVDVGADSLEVVTVYRL